MDVYWIDYIIIDIHEATNSTGSPFGHAFLFSRASISVYVYRRLRLIHFERCTESVHLNIQY